MYRSQLYIPLASTSVISTSSDSTDSTGGESSPSRLSVAGEVLVLVGAITRYYSTVLSGLSIAEQKNESIWSSGWREDPFMNL